MPRHESWDRHFLNKKNLPRYSSFAPLLLELIAPHGARHASTRLFITLARTVDILLLPASQLARSIINQSINHHCQPIQIPSELSPPLLLVITLMLPFPAKRKKKGYVTNCYIYRTHGHGYKQASSKIHHASWKIGQSGSYKYIYFSAVASHFLGHPIDFSFLFQLSLPTPSKKKKNKDSVL